MACEVPLGLETLIDLEVVISSNHVHPVIVSVCWEVSNAENSQRFGTSAGKKKGWIPMRGTLDINSRACSRLECSVEPILSMMTGLWRWDSGGFKLPLTVFNLDYAERRTRWARKGALEFSCNLQKPLDL